MKAQDLEITPIMMITRGHVQTTQVFERGNWMVKGKEVSADVPHSLNPLPNGAPRNRLGLAEWMTSKENPLTSRTMVNRIWNSSSDRELLKHLKTWAHGYSTPSRVIGLAGRQFMNEYKWTLKNWMKES
jgi:hypothetical protein